MYSVTVIENEHFVVLWLKQLFNRPDLGFTCTESYENPLQALPAVKENPPDLIISDIRMPGMSGLELLNQLREEKVTSPVIFVSAFPDFSYAQEGIRLGALDYLLKPVSMEDAEKCLLKAKEYLNRQSEVQRLEKEAKEKAQPDLGGGLPDDPYQRMLAFIDANYAKPIRLTDLAKETNMSAGYCSSLFQKEAGMSFSQYLIQLRMRKAKELLKYRNISINQVASLVGYADLFYFSREFKRNVGVTPSEYKNQQKGSSHE